MKAVVAILASAAMVPLYSFACAKDLPDIAHTIKCSKQSQSQEQEEDRASRNNDDRKNKGNNVHKQPRRGVPAHHEYDCATSVARK